MRPLINIIRAHCTILFVLGSTLLVYSLRIFLFDGTGDDGDSLTHFLIAKYACVHPDLFYDHWGKPFFTLLAFPFALLGFKGIQCFNLLNLLSCQIALYLIGKKLDLKFNWLPSLFLGFCLISIKVIPSGLTEPLCANILTWAVLGFLSDRYYTSTILISFLPFVRSEGLIILILAAIFLLSIHKWLLMPLLSFGHFVMGLLGMKYHNGDFFWTIHNIPYPVNGAFYGIGNPFHFILNTPEMLGPILTAMFLGGLILLTFLPLALYRKSSDSNVKIFFILIVGSVMGFYFFHSYAWAAGRFNSYGLTRVMFAVMPMISILAWIPIEFISRNKTGRGINIIFVSSLIGIHFYTLYYGKYALKKDDFNIKTSQEVLVKATNKLMQSEALYSSNLLLYDAPYLSVLLNIDPHGNKYERTLSILELNRRFPLNTIIIWDQYYSGDHSKILLDSLLQDNRLNLLFEVNEYDYNGKIEKCAVFKIKPEFAIDYSSPEVQNKLEAIKINLVNDSLFFPKLKKQSFKIGVTMDSCLNLNAKYFLEREKK